MITIILPTYNEKENITKLISDIFTVFRTNSLDGNIIVVDDNSPDGTGDFAERLSQKFPNTIQVIKRPKKMGLGTAYIDGFTTALKNGADIIFEMDADLSHSPKDIPRFIRETRNYDLVLGSRYIRDGGIRNWNVLRRMISRGGTIYARKVLDLPICDLTSGYKCFKRSVLKNINFREVKSDGYSFQIELTYRAHQMGYKIKEIPIIFTDRQVGISKFSSKIFWEAALMVWKLRLRK